MTRDFLHYCCHFFPKETHAFTLFLNRAFEKTLVAPPLTPIGLAFVTFRSSFPFATGVGNPCASLLYLFYITCNVLLPCPFTRRLFPSVDHFVAPCALYPPAFLSLGPHPGSAESRE